MESLFFFILFFLLGIAAFAARRSRYATDASGGVQQRSLARVAGIAYPVFFVIAVLVLAFGSFVTIEPGEVGVKVFFGDVQPDVLESGFHVINPLITVVRMD